MTLLAGPAHFGVELKGNNKITGEVIIAQDVNGKLSTACSHIANANKIAGKIAIVDRGGCMFIEKASINFLLREVYCWF